MPRRKRSVAADPVPPIPQNIESLVDPAMKRRAELLWRHCWSLRAAVDGQLNWFRQLRDTGDADHGEALRLAETVALCCGTLGPIIDRIVPGLMDELAPPSPDCEPGWQAATLQEYHANNCAMGLQTLYGVAGNIAKALEHDAEPLLVAVPTSCHAALSAPATTPPVASPSGVKPSTASSSLAPMPTDDPSLPDWMADLTPDKLLEQCRRLQTDWPLPDTGGVSNESQKIRELKAGLAILGIDTPAGLPALHDNFVERLKNWSTAKNRKLFDDFHASVDLIVTAIRNSLSATPTKVPATPSRGPKPVDDEAAKATRYAAMLVAVKSRADSQFTGKHRRVVELLVEAGGRKRIADVATDAGVGWDKPYKTGVDGFKKLIKQKLTSLGAAIVVVDNELRIELADNVPKPRRQTLKMSAPKERRPKKAAPPKRRQ